MISMTKLYDYLNWAFALVAILIITTLLSTVFSYYAIKDTVIDASQFVQNSVDNARQNIREDLQTIDSKLNVQTEQLEVIQDAMVYLTDNIKSSWSMIDNDIKIQLVHYFAEVEICSEDYPSYKVNIDFYWINPRIEDGKLMVLSDRFATDYHEYFPIFDKNIGYDANICSLKLLNK